MNIKEKIIVLISARLGSKRLPNKVLLNLNGKNTLDRIVNNLGYSKYIDKIIIATTTNAKDKKVLDYCKSKGYDCFKGSENNLFKRFYDAAKNQKPKIIVRVTGDNPYTSYEITDFMIEKHIKNKADFTYMDKKQLPKGVCPEIINFSSLKKILRLKVNFKYSEYMTYFFTNNSHKFKLNFLKPPKKFKYEKNLRLTLDYRKDFIFHEKFSLLVDRYKDPVKLSKIYEIAKKFPFLIKTNNHIKQKWEYNQYLINKINKSVKIL